jgi:hypothetical protein
MNAGKTIIISGLVFIGLGLSAFVGYKIYRSVKTKSGDPQKANREVLIKRNSA